VDLDPKSSAKIPHYFELDQAIVRQQQQQQPEEK
jgi:hypothetical protein